MRNLMVYSVLFLMLALLVFGCATSRSGNYSIPYSDGTKQIPRSTLSTNPWTKAEEVVTPESEVALETEVGEEAEVTGEEIAEEEETGPPPYTLGPKDVIRIIVQRHQEISLEVPIGPDGKIPFPLIKEIQVAGYTPREFSERLEEELSRYIREPEVTVFVMEYRSKVVYVLGQVTRPGKYEIPGNTISLREALLEGGVPLPTAALRRVNVISPSVEDVIVRKVDVHALLYKGKLEHDIEVEAGSIVYVPPSVVSKVDEVLAQLISPVQRWIYLEYLERTNALLSPRTP